MGATSLSDALKSNTTLTELYLSCDDKERLKRPPSTIYSFPFPFISTGYQIGSAGAASLSEALKSNTTLTELDLGGEEKKKTHKRHPSTIHSFPFSSQQQTITLEKKEQHH